MRKYIVIKLLAFTAIIFLLVQCKEPASLSAVVVTDGSSETNGALKTILENTGLFDVDISKKASPAFADYDVVVLNLQKANWTDEVKSSFEAYVKAGGGVVMLGASIGAFENWALSNDVFGVDAGKSLSKSNKVIDYQIINSKLEHPVTNGMPARWIHGSDFMIFNTTGLSESAEVLATSKADSIYGGNNSFVPVLYSTTYGEGRVFVSTLGNGSSDNQMKSMQCVGFITSLQRGAEWVATGVVSQEIPIDFPNAASTHYWETFNPLTLDEIIEKAANYEIGKSKKYLSDFSIRVRNSDGKAETYAVFEDKILEFLNSDATVDSKKYMCRELSWIGTEKSISVLEKLVNDKDLSESAQYALQRLRM